MLPTLGRRGASLFKEGRGEEIQALGGAVDFKRESVGPSLERGKREARSHVETEVPWELTSAGSHLLGEEGIRVRCETWRRGVTVYVNVCCGHGRGEWVSELMR